MSDERAQLELGLSKLAFEHHVPTFGICGGMQSMNVALGGTLIQDIPNQIATKIQHLPKKSAEKTSHLVHIEPKTLLRRIIKKSSMPVNSSHHQSVKAIPPSCHVSARAPDGVIEAIESSGHPFWLGVQWHPEFLYRQDVLQQRLFAAFLKAARYAARR
jgi:putative glutamine amidotransferase